MPISCFFFVYLYFYKTWKWVSLYKYIFYLACSIGIIFSSHWIFGQRLLVTSPVITNFMADQIVMKSQDASSYCGCRINDNDGGEDEMRRRTRWMGIEDERRYKWFGWSIHQGLSQAIKVWTWWILQTPQGDDSYKNLNIWLYSFGWTDWRIYVTDRVIFFFIYPHCY